MLGKGAVTAVESAHAASSAPTAPAVQAGPTFNWMNNPDGGSLRVARCGTHFATSWTDPKTGLRATHTTYPIVPQGGNPELDCGPQEDLDPNTPGDCYGGTLVAQGVGHFSYNDNDVWSGGAPAKGRMNDNTWGMASQGTLTGVNGNAVHYNGRYHAVYDPQGGDKFHETMLVNIH